MTAVHLINRLASRILDFQSPIKLLEKNYPEVRLKTSLPVKIFGCVAYVLNLFHKQDKWSPKALKCVFLGYSSIHKGYKLYHPVTRKYLVSKNVIFDETTFYYKTDIHETLKDLDYLKLLDVQTEIRGSQKESTHPATNSSCPELVLPEGPQEKDPQEENPHEEIPPSEQDSQVSPSTQNSREAISLEEGKISPEPSPDPLPKYYEHHPKKIPTEEEIKGEWSKVDCRSTTAWSPGGARNIV